MTRPARVTGPYAVILGVAILAAWLPSSPAAAQEPDAAALDKAVAAMRNVDPGAMSDEQKKAKAEEIAAAWQTILAAGKDGAARLKTEIEAVDKSGKADDFFKLGAGSLLWQIGKLDEAATIASVWRSTPLTSNYNYVFFPAFEAAKTQDERALGMLRACLADDKGSVFIPQHFLTIAWPLSQEFLWGTFGPKGTAALLEVLKTSKNPVELKSASHLLAHTQAVEALPLIRKLLKHENADVRRMAVRCLGVFGHPADYDVLVAGLKSQDSEDVWHTVFALYEYEDLRVVPLVVPLLESDDEKVRDEVFSTLTHLKTPASFEALHDWAADAPTDREKAAAKEYVDASLKNASLTWDQYEAKSAEEREAFLAGARAMEAARYVSKEDDRRLKHEELVEAAKGWKKQHRITGGEFEWVEDRHVLAMATPDDLDLLRDVEASLYWRLSDECLYQVRVINGLIRRIGRSRYRAEPGIAEKVEPVAGKAH